MSRVLKTVIILVLIAGMFVAYKVYLPIVVMNRTRGQSILAAIGRGLDYLRSQYDEETRLIRESPVVAPDRYWLATDNALAVHALATLDDQEMAAILQATLDSCGYTRHGLIEVLWGEPLVWPPHVENQRLVAQVGKKEVWLETRDGPHQFEDWREYTDLAMMGALNTFYHDNAADALQIYQQALEKFDGVGFVDKAFYSGEEHHYVTYKLALGLYTGVVVNAPLDDIGHALAEALLQKQATSGGFHTLYDGPTDLLANPSTETTSYALLALDAYLNWIRQ